MTEFSPSDFLRREVYPKLDAVDCNLLNGLDPKGITSSGSYPLTCPACKAKEAFYYPGSAYINCPRAKECGRPTSVWDAMLECDYENGEIFSVLCKAAGVEPPKRDQSKNQLPTSADGDTRIGRAIWQITQKMAAENAQPLRQFQADRGYSDEQMAAMRLGYYTNPDAVLTKLKSLNFTLEEALERGYIERNDGGSLWSAMSGRIVGYWKHPDGDDRLWGRIPTGSGDSKVKKYKFSISLKKDIPYLFHMRKNGPLVCVEGTMDAWALQQSGIWGCAVGGASINTGQALYLQGRNLQEVTHMVDGDIAGWNGAIGSIRSCESLGIVTSIVALGAGMDDADALLRADKVDVLLKLVEKRMNSGMYLALMLRHYYNVAAPDLQAINKIHATAELLTPTSRTLFEKHADLLGIRPDLRIEAGRIFGQLINAGLSIDEAASTVRRRTGFEIKIDKERSDG
ncbi:toprim domain-containing protein [Pseudomonas tritici]|uniref:toprim domain-containing protein n=1 Tax=Pseudomonas tritici TaxID=2745518 RepID=UPI00387B1D17